MWAGVVFAVLVVLFFRAMGRAGAPARERPVPVSWSAAAHQLAADVVRGARVHAALAAAHRDRLDRAWWAGGGTATLRHGPEPAMCQDDC
ncbi:hypothetical protein [Modestobacter sp. SYSU DS0657]